VSSDKGSRRPSLDTADTVPSDPGLADHAPTSSDPSSLPNVGDVLGGRYRILSELGRGGEGCVYRALDIRADMVVALKLLSRDASRVARFRRELQMARKVTHPNAVRIYDLVELPGQFGLSMELVEGETLERRPPRAGPLPEPELTMLAKDLASALAAAHRAGVTHRDLKPANVILRARGKGATITDFGISRMHGAGDEAPVSKPPSALLPPMNAEWAIIGTPLYMAPEQLDGLVAVGPSVDVYAYGLVVREAATGERLDDDATTLGALREARRARSRVPLASARGDLPPAFSAVIDRCLAVAPEQRWVDGGAIAAALDAPARRAPSLASPLGKVVGLVAVVAALGVVAALRLAPGGRHGAPSGSASAPVAPPAPPGGAVTGAHRVTFGDECEEFPSFTPDSARILYDGTIGANAFIYVLEPDGTSRRLTTVEGWDVAPSVSPDGRSVAFLRYEGEKRSTFVTDLDGKTPPRLFREGGLRPNWSADGRSIWAGDRNHPTRVDFQTGAVEESLAGIANMAVTHVLEGAGGARLAMFHSRGDDNYASIVLVGADGTSRHVYDGVLFDAFALTPGKGSVLVSPPDAAADVGDLAVLALRGGPPEPLVGSGVHASSGVAVSPDGKRIAWSTCRGRRALARLGPGGRLLPLPLSGDWQDNDLATIPGTKHLLTLSLRTGKARPWLIDTTGVEVARMIPLPDDIEPQRLAVSSDGRLVALEMRGRGILVVPIEGGAVTWLTHDPSDVYPTFLLRDVVFMRTAPGGTAQVMAVPIAGGEARALLGVGTSLPVGSPSGDRVAYLDGVDVDRVVPMMLDVATGATRPLADGLAPGRYARPSFSRDGRKVAIRRGAQEIAIIDIAPRRIDLDVRLADEVGSVLFDDEGLVVDRVQWIGDVWVADARFGP